MKRQSTWDNPELNLELYFCTEVLKLNSLHYGYWEKEENKVDLESVRLAQQRYTETLLDMIPADVHDILDIGCGIGDNARALAARGYHVTAISPDKAHAAYFKDVDQAQIEFENTTVEKFNSRRIYDLVLMSESQGYFAMDTGFSQSVRHLRPGGYLLVSGIFKQDPHKDGSGSHVESEYIRCAEGFNLVKRNYRDITHNTLPTLQYAFDCYNDYICPLYQILLHFIGENGMKKALVMKALFASELRNLSEVRRYYEERFNPDLFNERMRYSRILFQFEPNAFEKALNQSPAQKPAVSVIMCAYNEEQTIKDNLNVLAGCTQADEVIVVDDGSTDRTAEIVQALADGNKVKFIRSSHNQGKSHAMVTAALRAQGDILVFMDADIRNLKDSHIQKMIDPLIDKKADMVIGDPQYSFELAKHVDPFRSLSGERALWRSDFLPLVEQIRHSGFGVETLLNLSYKEQHKKVKYQSLEGLIHPTKLNKEKPMRATQQYLHEGSQIALALINRA